MIYMAVLLSTNLVMRNPRVESINVSSDSPSLSAFVIGYRQYKTNTVIRQ